MYQLYFHCQLIRIDGVAEVSAVSAHSKKTLELSAGVNDVCLDVFALGLKEHKPAFDPKDCQSSFHAFISIRHLRRIVFSI